MDTIIYCLQSNILFHNSFISKALNAVFYLRLNKINEKKNFIKKIRLKDCLELLHIHNDKKNINFFYLYLIFIIYKRKNE